jgi:hypothetical protein
MKKLIDYLQSPEAIRERCDRLFDLALDDKLSYFRIDLTKLEKCADYVIQVMRNDYPNSVIPFHSRWRHFEVGNVSRIAELDAALAEFSPLQKAKIKFDLAIISVLLDAGAGANWQYFEQETRQVFRRSEGLAVASFRMFIQGAFSSNRNLPLQADVKGLQSLNLTTLKQGFQVTANNPLVGGEGRLNLLRNLGKVLLENPEIFGQENPRPGNMVDYLLNQGDRQIKASQVLKAVLTGLGEIWPGRLTIDNINLGDVWIHSALAGETESDRFIPFHKLSQWLTYSLLEPLQELGVEITELNQLTGLPEYRNGGLCLDIGLLQLKNSEDFQKTHSVGSELIVEWRALTVSLLDRIATKVREKLNMTATELPLVKVLQGGTWTAGRKIALELRTNGIPPLKIDSDGTVF